MKQLKFPYLRYLVSPPGIKPQYVYRPVIPVKLTSGKKEVTFDALIDSGADECVFPGWIIEFFGRDIYKGKEKIFSGIGGSVLAYLHRTSLQIKNVRLMLEVYYSHDWDDMPFGLLGQSGFFNYFEVRFNYHQKFFLLRY